MAYQAAKVPPEQSLDMMRWIWRMENDLFDLPAPSLSVYLDTPLELARELILRKRPRDYTERDYDEHEADLDLQRRVRENYSLMVEQDLAGPWLHVKTVRDATLRPVNEIAEEIVTAIRASINTIVFEVAASYHAASVTIQALLPRKRIRIHGK
jgi:dTMP kinase